MTCFTASAAFVIAAVQTSFAFAWNDFGHKAIAHIAYEDLTQKAKERVNAILAQHPQHEALVGRVKTLDADLLAFIGAATWPDMVRSESNPLHATDERAALAGYRLADRLNRLFDPVAQKSTPVAKPTRKLE